MVSWTLKQQRDPNTLNRLQRVQESVYAQLQCLVPTWDVEQGSHWVSIVGTGLPLHLEILEVHPYTSFLRMTHHFDEHPVIDSQPEAHVRCYHDAEIAEVTAFDTVQGIQRIAHPSLPSRAILEMSWQRNRSLEKWLQYLLDLGHSRDTMQPDTTQSSYFEAVRKKGLITI